MEENKEHDLFQEMPEDQRADMLQDNCYKSEQMVVSRPYEPEQLAEFKEQLSEDSVQLAALTSELKKVQKEYEVKMKPLKNAIKEHITHLRNKFEETEEVVYLMDNQQEGLMQIFDKKGKFLYSRKLFPNEKQTSILSMSNRKVG